MEMRRFEWDDWDAWGGMGKQALSPLICEFQVAAWFVTVIYDIIGVEAYFVMATEEFTDTEEAYQIYMNGGPIFRLKTDNWTRYMIHLFLKGVKEKNFTPKFLREHPSIWEEDMSQRINGADIVQRKGQVTG